jgi:hypothetical protein
MLLTYDIDSLYVKIESVLNVPRGLKPQYMMSMPGRQEKNDFVRPLRLSNRGTQSTNRLPKTSGRVNNQLAISLTGVVNRVHELILLRPYSIVWEQYVSAHASWKEALL